MYFILICLAIGGLGGFFTQSSIGSWYPALQKPPLNPPNWVFAPVWTILYFFMGITGALLWSVDTPIRNRLRTFFVTQLILNGLWSYLFFGLRAPFIALLDIVILWIILLMLTTQAWRIKRSAGILLIPYLIWVSFAVYLNAAIWRLNR